jgi:hypothetical protein
MQLGRVYSWFFQKLEAIGMMSGAEKEEEDMFMNPGKIEEIMKKAEEAKQCKR